MPLVYRDEQPTTGLCSQEHGVDPACWESVCRGRRAPATTHQEHTAAGGSQELFCRCVPMTQGVIAARHPALHPREGTSTQTTDSQPVDRFVLLMSVSSLCGGFLYHSDDSAHLSGLHNDTILKVGSLKLR